MATIAAPRRGRVPWLVPLLLALAPATSARAVTNTGYDASNLPLVACNGRVGFRVYESSQNSTDLNGDGDHLDAVLHVLDLSSGIVTNVGIDASGPLACGGDKFYFGVSELSEGNADRNGDGDTFDKVLEVYDAATTTLTNVGLAVSAIVASDQLVAFTVDEAAQGSTELNGDFDRTDQVLHVLDPTTLAVTNLMLEASDFAHIVVQGPRLGFFLSEDKQGHVDFNADGDASDMVAILYDASTPTLVNTQRAVDPTFGLQIDSAVAAFVVSEQAQGGISQNGDNDAGDAVMDLYCFAGAPCVTSGLIELHIDAGGGFTLQGDLLAFRTREKAQGPGSSPTGSLNTPDLDARDTVIQYYRISTGVLRNTKLAGVARVRIVGDVLAFGVPERLQNRTPLNGDADVRDMVLTLFDTVTQTITNTGQALSSRSCRREATQAIPKGPCLAAADDFVLFGAGEKEQNRTDQNGDGDTHDIVGKAWKVSTNTLTSTGLAADHKGALSASGTLGAFRVAESSQGGGDLNGDLDAGDRVVAVYDSTTATTTNLHQAAEPGILIEGRTVIFRTDEADQNVDLNGDGDKNDRVLQYQTF